MSDEPPPNARLLAAKEAWARQGRLLTGQPQEPSERRLPPGQHLTRGFPVLDLGTHPNLRAADWQLTVGGLVARPAALSWRAFQALPQSQPVSDIHCVTGWSRFDNRWQGVSTRDLLAAIAPLSQARFVIIKSHDGYTTGTTLADFAHADALLATHWDGAPLSREHGGPVRLVLPRLYFWKSAKWLRQLWFAESESRGYWESRGYHRRGDPWREERYGS